MPGESNSNLDRRAMLAMSASAIAGSVVERGHAEKNHSASNPANSRRRFENKVVIITGATSGIGRAAAEQFASEGGKVAFCGRRENLGHEVEAGIRSRHGEATYIRRRA
jgi:FlaA1/EpsC-like NDP-sugar epimerase